MGAWRAAAAAAAVAAAAAAAAAAACSTHARTHARTHAHARVRACTLRTLRLHEGGCLHSRSVGVLVTHQCVWPESSRLRPAPGSRGYGLAARNSAHRALARGARPPTRSGKHGEGGNCIAWEGGDNCPTLQHHTAQSVQPRSLRVGGGAAARSRLVPDNTVTPYQPRLLAATALSASAVRCRPRMYLKSYVAAIAADEWLRLLSSAHTEQARTMRPPSAYGAPMRTLLFLSARGS